MGRVKTINGNATPSRLCIGLLAMGLLGLGSGKHVRAFTLDEVYKFRPGVVTSHAHPLTSEQSQTLLAGLRTCSGFSEMKFDENGRLDLGDRTRIVGGSETARRLMVAAVDSADSFIIENRYRSPTVAFAQIESMDTYVDGRGGKHGAWYVRLDFFDFTTLRGAGQTLTAFDPTMNLLHELVHGVLKLKDPVDDTDSLGDCERHLNLIRAELGLPERRTYLPRSKLTSTADSAREILQAELAFVQKRPRAEKQQNLYVTFELERVCFLGNAQVLAGCFREVPRKQ